MFQVGELDIIKNIQNLENESLTKIMLLMSAFFHFYIYSIVILFLYSTNNILLNQLIIIVLGQVVLLTIKNIVKRKRPFKSRTEIKLIESLNFDSYSFPSGHTLNAFLFAHFIKENLKINIDFLPYLVGLSRVYLGVHYPTDILGSFILFHIILNVKENINLIS